MPKDGFDFAQLVSFGDLPHLLSTLCSGVLLWGLAAARITVGLSALSPRTKLCRLNSNKLFSFHV